MKKFTDDLGRMIGGGIPCDWSVATVMLIGGWVVFLKNLKKKLKKNKCQTIKK